VISNVVRFAKNQLRGPRRKARRKIAQLWAGFGEQELRAALKRVGLRRGDAVLIHSSASGFEGFRGTLNDVIAILEDVVGTEGTLIMPTLSMAGSAIEFAKSGRVFDPRTTPSQVGLLTELFRRSPGVKRSIHPTHSVAAWGADTDWWLADQYLAKTPCGSGTPFHRLIEKNGKILLAGTGIASMTFYHCAEELLEPRMPESPFTIETFRMRFRVAGEIRETAPTRLYEPTLSRRRNLAPLEAELRNTGRWRETQTGTLRLILLEAQQVLDTLEDMARRGVFCYNAQ
jgi:aminoglycoside 3-N-acetyltransferase